MKNIKETCPQGTFEQRTESRYSQFRSVQRA